MLVSDFDFDLPAESIAQQAAPRGTSRLLVVGERSLADCTVADLPDLLAPGDLVVGNDTRVIPARLFGATASGVPVEILLVERLATREWHALVKPGRRARPGTVLRFGGEAAVLDAEVTEKHDDGRHRLRFSAPVEPHLEALGHVPLPPYIKRPDAPADRERYQTVWAREPGAIAAPTAGLHFTPEILDAVRARGVGWATVTLHVGIGTFKPVTAELVHEHRMEAERYTIPDETAAAIAATRARGGAVVAIGTTVVRALESAAARDAEAGGAGIVRPGDGRTELFITPGYTFRVVDRLVTNFHLPKSTLLMLVCALAGRERVMHAYREAIARGYRFYSYGDAMLLTRDA